MDLRLIGADARIDSLFSSYSRRGSVLGRIFFADRGRYRLFTVEGERPATVAGRLLLEAGQPANLPAVGDWVAARCGDQNACVIESVLPRRNYLSRRAAGKREEEQVMAANIDTVLVLCGLDRDFNLRRLERYLTIARESGIDPVIVLNKADLCVELAARLDETIRIARGAPVVSTIATADDGLAGLLPLIVPGQTLAVIGSSGAGKTTLLNRLMGRDEYATRETRAGDNRGRHTTTFRQLAPLPNGSVLIDTPGMRELQLWAAEDALDETFEDIAHIASQCRFRDCSHRTEPDCAIREALRNGDIDEARWRNYEKLRAEIRRHEYRTGERAALEEKKRVKKACKAMRDYGRR